MFNKKKLEANPFFYKNSIKATLLGKCIELVAIVFFIVIFYHLEIWLIKYIYYKENKFGYLSTLYPFLYNLNSNFLPFKMWFIAWPLLFAAISFIVLKKWRWYFICLVGMLLSSLLVADKLFYSAFSSLITTSSFKVAHQLWDIKSSVFNLIAISDLLKILLFLVFVFLGIVVNKYIDSDLEKNPIAFAIDKFAGILLFFLAFNSFNTAFYLENSKVEWVLDDNNQKKIIAHASESDLKKSKWRNKQHFNPPFQNSILDFAVSFGVLNYHTKNIYDTIKKTIVKKSISDAEILNIAKWLENKKQLNETNSPFWALAEGRNIFLIALESVHPLLINLEINNVPVTPTLNQLKADALYWDHCVDQSYGGGSSDSEFAAMTGMLPSRQYLSTIDLAGKISLKALPSSLKKHNYHTFSFHGYKAAFWNRNINHPYYGFEQSFFMKSFAADQLLGMGIPDKEFFSQSLDILKDKPEPFFAYMISLSNHHPYEKVPENFKHMFADHIDAGPEITGYLQLVRYTDDALGKFIVKAKNYGFWENSVFIIYGDHVPPLSQTAKEQFEKITGGSLNNFIQQRTPLLIIIPGMEGAISDFQNEYASVVGDQHDIFPTVFHLLGLKTPYGITGTHLFVENQKRDPLFMTNKIFIYNGMLYHGPTSRILSPNFKGPPNSSDSTLTSPREIQANYLKALNDMRNHEVIYEYDAQAKAIKNR